ncbi:hypothetical protein N7462_008284 [Penicillium macrosclerotiorum]|uniref:uncharacterized protein n=1 Tax=Penicillium macrosclerotiorum TaxID=303699 RepID=UPI0025482F02|nr:uncharacterized protein N7462_008284 [Penicillium macrosclerotiorum]KAJ5675387.1 hypothetical protein N7462_008284 [Penicillium macrosclerotiorum]
MKDLIGLMKLFGRFLSPNSLGIPFRIQGLCRLRSPILILRLMGAPFFDGKDISDFLRTFEKLVEVKRTMEDDLDDYMSTFQSISDYQLSEGALSEHQRCEWFMRGLLYKMMKKLCEDKGVNLEWPLKSKKTLTLDWLLELVDKEKEKKKSVKRTMQIALDSESSVKEASKSDLDKRQQVSPQPDVRSDDSAGKRKGDEEGHERINTQLRELSLTVQTLAARTDARNDPGDKEEGAANQQYDKRGVQVGSNLLRIGAAPERNEAIDDTDDDSEDPIFITVSGRQHVPSAAAQIENYMETRKRRRERDIASTPYRDNGRYQSRVEEIEDDVMMERPPESQVVLESPRSSPSQTQRQETP